MKKIPIFILLSFLLFSCTTLSSQYLLTAQSPDGENVLTNSSWSAEGSGIYSVRNALCSNYPGATIIIRHTSGEELKGESPYQCNGTFVQKTPNSKNDIAEMWDFSFDGRSWTLAHSAKVTGQFILEYVPEGDSIEHWSELVTSHYVTVSPSIPAYEEIMKQGGLGKYSFNYFTRHFMEHCKSPYTNIIEEKVDSILYEWHHQGCPGHPPQYEIKRMQEVDGGTLSLSFTKKTERLEERQRYQWVELLLRARVNM